MIKAIVRYGLIHYFHVHAYSPMELRKSRIADSNRYYLKIVSLCDDLRLGPFAAIMCNGRPLSPIRHHSLPC